MTLDAVTDGTTSFELPTPTKDVDSPADRHDIEHESVVGRTDWIRVGVVALTAALVWFHVWEPVPRVSLLGVAGTIAGGWPIVHEAWRNLLDRRMTMELSVTIGLVAALLVGEFFTALLITTLVLAAEVIEGLTVGRGRRAIRDLLDLLPSTATVRHGSGSVRMAVAVIKAGDAVLVSPGERIPVDGIVRGGESYVDQSAITGESVPVATRTGSPVFAGTINQSGALEVIVDRVGRETSFGKIIEAVERAERSQAPVEKAADRYAGYLVVFALACAALTLAVTRDARSTIAVIIVAGACGIAAGTPLAILGAIGRAARAGAIITGGRHLEALWDVEVVALDKTGTVTVGAPAVASLHPAEGISNRVLLETAAIAERRSEHPLARAIIAAADEMGASRVEPTSFTYSPGRGIVARSGRDDILVGSWAFARQQGVIASVRARPPRATSEVVVVRDGLFLGTIWIADTVRPDARQAIRRIREAGLRTVLLTGDARPLADAVGDELQVDDVQAELLPDEKTALVRELTRRGCRVAMVGDGINDAPALMEATVGLALGAGTNVARESADIVVLGHDLSTVADVVHLARRTRNIIRFNVAGTMAVDGVGVALAAAGLLNPPLAAFIRVASELAFILNSARLLPPARAH